MTVKWMFHATAMGPSYDAIVEPLRTLLGCRVLHDDAMDTPGIERRGGMTWIADNSIEIGEPYGATSPVQRFVDRFGGGMHSVAVQVDDLDAALARAVSLGVDVADRPLDGIAFTRPSTTGDLLFEWNHNPQDDDPRWGATLAPEPTSILQPQHFSYVAAVVENPTATAERLSDIFGTSAHELADPGADDEPAASVAIGDCSIALFPMPTPERAATIWATLCSRPRFVGMAVTVPDADAARASLAEAGYEVSHVLADDSLVVHGQSLPFPIVVTNVLLPGDPRG
jgi:catechol 2,3-dioxygenase-like lactoylglutathione lyase family enzyme